MPWSMASRGLRMRDLLAVDEDAAGIHRVGPEDGAHDLGAPGADQPGQAHDLAGARRKLMSSKTPRRVRPSTRRISCPGRHRLLGRVLGQLAADHERDELRPR